jgi:cyanobactin maturation PatA/PatG family protease
VLAVGALSKNGEPYESSNWGDAYRANGVLAPGEGITGAAPGGGTAAMTGSSFATPIVSGVAAALLSIQLRNEGKIDPRAVADAILGTATACPRRDAAECRQYLAGIINIPGAYASISKGGTTMADLDLARTRPRTADITGAHASSDAPGTPEAGVRAAGAGIPAGPEGAAEAPAETNVPATADAGITTAVEASADATSPPPASEPPVQAAGVAAAPTAGASPGIVPATSSGSVAPSGDCNCQGVKTSSYVYAIVQIGTDLGSEANRDAFRQLMPEVVRNDLDPPVRIQPNPYDVVQLVDYLDSRPSESTKLIWTLNLDLTPIYAVEAEPAYPEEVYGVLRQALRNGALPTDNEDYVARASIPGVLTNRTVQLFSGQIVPVVVAQARGLYVWKETALINEVIDALRPTHPNMDENYVRQLTRIFLDKVYYECRNLGASSPDRALNFAATNAYQIGSAIARGITSGQFVPGSEGELFALDSIDVTKSPYCRMDSDCWDVRIKFFSPENDHRAKSVYQFTIDVSDEMPVSLAPEHQFLTT